MQKLVISCLIVSFLSGCSTIAPTQDIPTQMNWKQRQAALSRLNYWQLNGKIAVQTAQDAGSASLRWQQNREQYTISLMGPLGSNGLTLSGQPGRVIMETANGKQIAANSPEKLLASQWGWNLPVSHLRFWIRGLPVPGIAAQSQFDSYHRLSRLSQAGTQIQYLSCTTRNGIELPQRIEITGTAIKAKIVINEWNT